MIRSLGGHVYEFGFTSPFCSLLYRSFKKNIEQASGQVTLSVEGFEGASGELHPNKALLSKF